MLMPFHVCTEENVQHVSEFLCLGVRESEANV